MDTPKIKRWPLWRSNIINNMNNKIIFTFTHKKLIRDIAHDMGYEIGKIYKRKFADGEVMIKSASEVKNKDVVVIQSTSKNAPTELFHLLLLLDSIKRSGANSIKLVMPYFAYSRQERVSWINEPISCQVVAKIIDSASFEDLYTFDLHHPVIETFFSHPIYNLNATKIFADYYLTFFKDNNINIKDVVIISPDHGSNSRAHMLAESLGNIETVILDKVRPTPNSAEHLEIDGKKVKGKICLIIDDILDTGGTIVSAAKLLYSHKAKTVLVGASHPLLSGDCVEKLEKAGVKDIVVTNTIEKRIKKSIKVINIKEIIEEVIG